MKEFLKKLIAQKEARAKELKAQIRTSEDINEVRALGDTLEALLEELTEAKQQLEEIDEPAPDGGNTGNNGDDGEGNSARSFNPINTMNFRNGTGTKAEDPLATMEYRKAFMNFCVNGTPIPKELRANANTTKSTDASAAIPTTTLNEIVQELKSYGNIYAQVRKLNVEGGVHIPVISLKPTATWITADAGESESTTQKVQANASVSFSYYGLECKVAQTLLVNVTTIDAFEEVFTTLAVEAIAQALDIAIIKGSGTGEPTGVVNDARVPSKNVVTLTADDFTTWEGWKKKVFGKMKKSYRDGKFFMAQSTFDGYIDGMVDLNGQPIARVNYGIDAAETYRFGGKDVETVEEDVIAGYDDASAGDVVAVFFKPTDYAINSNMAMNTVRWVDNDTNEIKNKVIMICDGKLVDPNGVIVIKKGTA